MKRLAPLFLVLLLAVPACNHSATPSTSPTPVPKLSIDPALVRNAILKLDDVGGKWELDSTAAPSTVQIGGRVGPSNVENSEADATSGFKQKGGSGYLSVSVFLVPSEELARAVMGVHVDAEAVQRWTQERQDGGKATFANAGPIGDIPALGDESYSASLRVTVVDAAGKQTPRKVEYVVFRINRLLAFLVAQDARVGVYARRQEQKLASLVG